ncbi:hypothetical protein GF324_04255 [bacterium]|nr:hypothetical protein [bacterium]
MKTMHVFALLLLGLLFSTLPVRAAPTTWVVTPGKPNEVKFISEAPVESFEGKTTHIEGEFTLDPQNLDGEMSGRLQIDVKTLDTGIKIRNGHMFDNHLHPDQYPHMTFELTEVVGNTGSLQAGENSLLVGGTFTCHGVTNEITPEVMVDYTPERATLDVTARFTVRLSDYNIDRPQFLFMKLAEEQKVVVRFTANAE